MSARHILVLALVAYVTVQASSYPYGTKGGQSFYAQEPLKSSYAPQQQSQQTSQQLGESVYRQEPVVAQQQPAAPVVSAPVQVETTPFKGQLETAPVKGQLETAPVKGQFEAAPVKGQYEAAPVKGQLETAPVKGQSFYQQEQRFEAPRPQVVAQSTSFEAAPVAQSSQSSAPAQVYEPAPMKGLKAPYGTPVQHHQESAPVKGAFFRPQTFYQQERRVEAPRVPLVQQRFESVPLKSAQSYYAPEPLKGQFFPQRQETVAAVQQPVLSAPAQTVQMEQSAPVKGQAVYQQEQRFEAPRAPMVAQPQHFETAPVAQVSSYKA